MQSYFRYYKILLLFIIGLLISTELPAAQTYWFSDTPPSKEIAKKMRSSHDGLVQRSRRDGTVKRLWLREGEDPMTSSYVKEGRATLVLLDAKKTLQSVSFINEGYAKFVTFPPDVYHVDIFADAQKEARDHGVGLWNGDLIE